MIIFLMVIFCFIDKNHTNNFSNVPTGLTGQTAELFLIFESEIMLVHLARKLLELLARGFHLDARIA